MLFDEEPLLVPRGLAKALGINEAIILQQIHYWIKKKLHYNDGRYWTYNTYEDWAGQFDHLSPRAIRRYISKLEKMGILDSNQYNKKKYDHTKWYTINYKTLSSYTPNGQTDVDKLDTSDLPKVDTSEVQQVDTSINTKITTKNTTKNMGLGLFNEFWSAYPLKVGKKKAWQSFSKINNASFPIIMSALSKQKASDQWIKDGGKFIPHPTTWLNGERWNDEVSPNNNRVKI